jgi:hypothetical protein
VRRGAGWAAEEPAAVAIGDGQRLAVMAVPRREVACAGSASHCMGGTKVAVELARRPQSAALALLGPEAVALEEGTAGRACRPGPAGMAYTEDRHQLLGPPGWLPWSRFQDRRHPMVRRVAGRGAGPTGARCEALRAVGEIAVDPVAPSLAADVVTLAARSLRGGHGEKRRGTAFSGPSARGAARHGVPPSLGPRLLSNCHRCPWTQQ